MPIRLLTWLLIIKFIQIKKIHIFFWFLFPLIATVRVRNFEFRKPLLTTDLLKIPTIFLFPVMRTELRFLPHQVLKFKKRERFLLHRVLVVLLLDSFLIRTTTFLTWILRHLWNWLFPTTQLPLTRTSVNTLPLIQIFKRTTLGSHKKLLYKTLVPLMTHRRWFPLRRLKFLLIFI